jgi:RNA polymerase sigma factor (sigma-70 family)
VSTIQYDSVRSHTALSVAELLRDAGAGDAAAWDEIVRRYTKLVWARVRSYRMQDADALDAVQMTWLRLAENCDRVRSPERLAGWLATTAGRECLRILRQNKCTAGLPDTMVDTPDTSVQIEQHVIDRETAQLLRDVLAELPPRRRTVLQELFVDEPKPYAEIARTAGIPAGSIGPTRARALEQLRGMLGERGWQPETE